MRVHALHVWCWFVLATEYSMRRTPRLWLCLVPRRLHALVYTQLLAGTRPTHPLVRSRSVSHSVVALR